MKFEEDFSNYCGVENTVGTANGLDALNLIFRAYKEMDIMQDGDEVLVPSNTYIASILSVTDKATLNGFFGTLESKPIGRY